MNLQQMKELEDFKANVEERQRYASSLYQDNVVPLLEKFHEELTQKLIAYFQDNGFNIQRSGSVVSANYKNLQFDISEAPYDVSIKEGNALKAFIRVSFRSYQGGSMSIPPDEFLAEKARIQHRLDGIETNIECYSKPEVYYEFNGATYDNADDLIKVIF